MSILIPSIVLGGLGLVFGLWISFARKIFAVKTDPRVEQILDILPGSNCGACGFAGCQGFATALVGENVDVGGCAPGGNETQQKLAEILGVEAKQRTKQIATLICGGGTRCTDKYDYAGPKTCAAASMLLSGQKSCNYACLGFADCVRACPFDAMRMGEDGLPQIDEDKCTACRKCIEACPKNVLLLTGVDKDYHVRCYSNDKGAVVAKICKVSCIGCGKCVKACPHNAIIMEDNLARIVYDKCKNAGECFNACPMKTIIKREGKNG